MPSEMKKMSLTELQRDCTENLPSRLYKIFNLSLQRQTYRSRGISAASWAIVQRVVHIHIAIQAETALT